MDLGEWLWAMVAFFFWFLRGHYREGSEWVRRVLELGVSTVPGVHERVLFAATEFRRILGDSAQAEAFAAVQSFWLDTLGGDEMGMRCDVIRLPRREFAFGFDPRVMVVVRGGAVLPAFAIDPLRQALGLTAAEAEIALRLANGVDRDQMVATRR